MKRQYRLLLDSGTAIGSYGTRTAARAALATHNARAREQKARGDLVSLRIAVAVVEIDVAAAIKAQARKIKPTRKPRKARKEAA